MKILSIETTCDDTAMAIIEYNDINFNIYSNTISSQIKEHNKFGGIVPELASREHIKNFIPVLDETLKELNIEDIDYLAITNKGGGLIGSQVVGVELSKTLSFLFNKEIISVNHIRAHIMASFFNFNNDQLSGNITEPEYPIIALTVSGGHTQLILIKDFLNWEIIGQTIDDSAGECFDKIAKLLDLGYPGGPIISKLAEDGDPKAIDFPRPMINSNNFDFSFSGLKTSILYYIQKNIDINLKDFKHLNNLNKNINYNLENICASSQAAINDVLIYKSLKAIKKFNPKTFILAGGVAANKNLRLRLKEKIESETTTNFLMPTIPLCMDNALMVNIAAYFNIKNKSDIFDYKNLKSSIERKI